VQPLVGTDPIPEIHQRLDKVLEVAKASRPALEAIQADWDSRTQGSGVGIFLALLGLTVAIGLAKVARMATNVDMTKATILKWTHTPTDRDFVLRDLKNQEEPALPQLMPYLDDGSLTPSEVAGLIDLVSNWDEPVVHARVLEALRIKHDLVKGAAVLAMARFEGSRWDEQLAELLEQDDPAIAGNAAKALAERKATSMIPKIRSRFDASTGALKEAFRDALERLEPKVQ